MGLLECVERLLVCVVGLLCSLGLLVCVVGLLCIVGLLVCSGSTGVCREAASV